MENVNKKLHIICGMCGCDSMLSYSISEAYEETDDDNDEYKTVQDVCIHCDNCGTITVLDEVIGKEEY